VIREKIKKKIPEEANTGANPRFWAILVFSAGEFRINMF
jgi:hypothetical protein